jgi:hypothetical protein
MKKKTSIVLGAVVVVVIAIALSAFLLTGRQQVAIPYSGTLTTVKGYSGAYLSLQFHVDKTLFSCQITATYLATNGSSVKITRQLGVVDQSSMKSNTDLELSDYPIGNQSLQIPFNQTSPLSTVTIDAYGYSSP